MKQPIIYNLEEFAAKYHLTDIFGAYAAHFSINGEENGSIPATGDESSFCHMSKERTLFAKLLLVKSGKVKIHIANKLTEKETGKDYKARDLLIVSARQIAECSEASPDFEAECILVDEFFTQETLCFHLSDEKYKNITAIFHFVRDIVSHRHINKIEMIRSMINVLKLMIEELPYEQCSVSHDFSHKKELYEIFLYHLYRCFRKERQIRFYADKLNVSTAYLSRLVKEMSGSTVNDHVTSLVYKEICNLLKQSDMTIGEIATHLNFSDQSALTNFFKLHSGMTPLAYRGK